MLIPNRLDEALHALGYESFRPGQREVIEAILSGRDALYITSTGSGKSLTYQLASILLEGITVVISPLISLMLDQVRSLQGKGVACGAITSVGTTTENNNVLSRLREGRLRLILVAPERFSNEDFQSALGRQKVSLLVADEVHSVLAWGHAFRSEYLRISSFHREMGSPPLLGLTATATPEMRSDLIQNLGMRSPYVHVMSFDRPNIYLKVTPAAEVWGKLEVIGNVLKANPTGAAIVYFATRRDVDESVPAISPTSALSTRGYFNLHGRLLIPYHSGLSQKPRREAQKAFMDEPNPIMFATCAFGMGIDRPDVRVVIHHKITSSLEGYYQEIGRAGRDGLPAQAVLLWDKNDRAIQDFFIKQEAYLPHEYRSLYYQVGAGRADVHRDNSGLYHLKKFGLVAKHQRDWVVTAPWDGPECHRLLEHATRVRINKVNQLNTMLRYVARNKLCKREQILNHFGEHLILRPDLCCDVCNAEMEKMKVRLGVATY